MIRSLTYWAGIAGAAFFFLSTVLAGFQFSDYSHISQFISESYAIDTPYGRELRYFGFFPSGILLAIFGFFAPANFLKSSLTKIGFWGLAIFYGFTTVIVSLFPCDKGCNKEMIDPSIAQVIHNLAGSLTYMFVPLSMILLGIGLLKTRDVKVLSISAIVVGIICMLFIGLMASDPTTKFAGLFQRIIEGSILLWIVACSFSIGKKDRLNISQTPAATVE